MRRYGVAVVPLIAGLLFAGCGASTEPTPSGSLLIQPAVDTLPAGVTRRLTARVVQGPGDTVAVTDVLWSSSNPDIASVTPDGSVTGVRSGDATIVALLADQRATAAVRVERRFLAASVTLGPQGMCALDASGQAWCLGNNYGGQIGIGITGDSRATFTAPVAGGHTFASIGLNERVTCGLAADGQAWCWGEGRYMGGLGSAPAASAPIPVPADPVHTYDALATGSETCGLVGGATWCWGSAYSRPTQLPFGGTPPALRALSAGAGFDCGISTSSQAICWRPGFTSDFATQFGGAVLGISAGTGFQCAVLPDHSGACRGRDDVGQLGGGTVTDSTTAPLTVTGGHAWTEISAGTRSACGLATDGAVYCWGANESGQLGRGDSTASAVPVAVATATRFTHVSAGGFGACAISTTDELYCWGANWAPRPVPVGY